jgi:HEAT repeat protein
MELLRERGTTEIVKLLADEDPRVQFKAADALVLLGDLHEASALLWMVQKGPERGRVMAAHVLGRLRDPAAMLALLAAAEDPSSLVREAAERALKAIFGSTET